MLQASLLQYPHFGVFPGAAAAAAAAAAAGSGLYPGLAASAAAGVHFPPADFYTAQSLPPGLLMSMKMPNVSAANWLGLDRFANCLNNYAVFLKTGPLYYFQITHTHTHTTVLRLCGICPGKPG